MYLKNGKKDGIDVASYQKGINIQNISADFVFVKATQGSWYKSPTFVAQYKSAKDADKLLGIYHYTEGSDIKKEVSFFLETIGDRLGEAVLALDEEGTSNPVFNTKKMVAYVTDWMREVYNRTGVKPILYMSKSIFQKYDWSTLKNEGYKIWPAQYSSNETTGYKDEPWTDDKGWGKFDTSDVVIYQYSSKGRLSGYGGNLDLDKAFVDEDEWKSMASGKTPVKADEGPSAPIPDKLYVHIDPQTAVINLALAELGYQEKKSNSNLDRKHTNVGKNNYTKYARDMHKVYPQTMDANPIPWCDAFCDWIMYMCFGVSTARSLLGQFDDYTVASAGQFIKKGGWVTHDFEPGDQVFFSSNDKVSGIYHTGYFWKYENNRTYVIEGNTSDGTGVNADGGSVCIKSYPRVPNKIVGAGRPKWSLAGEILVECPEARTLAYDSSGPAVKVLQSLIGTDVDGHFGPKTKAALEKFQKNNGIDVTGICDDDTWPVLFSKGMISTGWPKLERGSKGTAVRVMQAIVGTDVDSSFGPKTDTAVRNYQKKKGLVVDGVCGYMTWLSIMGDIK